MNEISFGIKECKKCEYYLRCEECVYNKKDIEQIIKFEKIQARKEVAEEILQIVGDIEPSPPLHTYTLMTIYGMIKEKVKQYKFEEKQINGGIKK